MPESSEAKPKITGIHGNGNNHALAAEVRQLRNDMTNQMTHQKITDMRLQQISAKQARQQGHLTTVSKHITEISGKVSKLSTSVNALKQQLTHIAPIQAQGAVRSQGFRGGRGSVRKGSRGYRPSLSGGVGYVYNRLSSPVVVRPPAPAAGAVPCLQGDACCGRRPRLWKCPVGGN